MLPFSSAVHSALQNVMRSVEVISTGLEWERSRIILVADLGSQFAMAPKQAIEPFNAGYEAVWFFVQPSRLCRGGSSSSTAKWSFTRLLALTGAYSTRSFTSISLRLWPLNNNIPKSSDNITVTMSISISELPAQVFSVILIRVGLRAVLTAVSLYIDQLPYWN